MARPVDQIPSEIGDCGADCIIMSWPWFLDLKVKHVIEGKIEAKTVTALNVQHTYLRSRYGVWLLRRNSAGGFNILLREDTSGATPCTQDAPPVAPYLRTGAGQSLEAAREVGVSVYGHHRN